MLNGTQANALSVVKAHKMQQLDPNLQTRVGHMSIETPNNYASWWPHPDEANQIGIYNVITASNSTYDDDVESESFEDRKTKAQLNDGEPDLRVCLYSLDVSEIEKCFTNIVNSEFGYVLAGNKKIVSLTNSTKGQSCASLAYELLEAGGMLALSSMQQDLTAKWFVVTPDNLAELVKNAKQKEWVSHPETQSFSRIQDEFIPSVQPSSCTIS